MSDIIIPSNPKDRQALKAGIIEITDAMAQMESLRDRKKEIVDVLKEKYELSPKYINKMAKIMYDRSYESMQQENEDFEVLYESVIEGAQVPNVAQESDDEE